MQTDDLAAFIAQLATAVTTQDYVQMQALKNDPIRVGAYVQAHQNVTMFSGPGVECTEIGGVFDRQTALVTGAIPDGT